MRRRRFLTSLTATAFFGSLGITEKAAFSASADANQGTKNIQARLHELEVAAQGRLGVHIFDTASGQEYGYRSDERFMMLSSFKLLASALVLQRVDSGLESLERRIIVTKNDIIPWSPITEKNIGGVGMTLAQLCEATITTSDNAAANLILASYGGPASLTAFARQLGDNISRLDRTEPELNLKSADGLMDTTSPRAMLHSMKKVVLDDALSTRSRAYLQYWLLGNTTGGKRLKAGLPSAWKIGDKTGTNATDANDIGVIWPPERPPVLVAAYLADSQASSAVKETTIAAVGALAHDLLRQ